MALWEPKNIPQGLKPNIYAPPCGTTKQLGEKLFVPVAIFPRRGFERRIGGLLGLMFISSGRFCNQKTHVSLLRLAPESG
jgi:hypothetical protein